MFTVCSALPKLVSRTTHPLRLTYEKYVRQFITARVNKQINKKISDSETINFVVHSFFVAD